MNARTKAARQGRQAEDDRDERHVPQRYRVLPEPIAAEDTTTEQPPEDPPDPEGGRDTERDFMLRYA
jgi:hypothetical protein